MQKQLEKLKATYREFPHAFWVYSAVVFIDRLGGSLLFPFYALYLTEKFGINMAQVGGLFALFSISGFIGSAIGGALTDRMGRKSMLIFSLVMSSLSALVMGLVNDLMVFAALSVFVGILGSVGGPAHEAIVADVLPAEKRPQGYGIIRVIFNLAVVIGPAIGGFLATRSYLALFITDAVISILAALIVHFYMPETKPAPHPDAKHETMLQTFAGYGRVFRDSVFLAFLAVTFLQVVVYINMNTTLGVYLRDHHGVPEVNYGWLLSLNAAMVVVIQFWLTRKLEKQKPMIMMAVGTALYALGFAMYGFVAGMAMFVLAMVIITVGEMVVSPFGQTLVASLAPEEMRGRYMAVSGLTWGLAFAVGPLLAGIVLDNFDPNLLWLACGTVGTISTLGYLLLHKLHHSPAPGFLPEPAAAD
ncbi:MAG: MDR family MFS transporter [Chloroflexota bacterium]